MGKRIGNYVGFSSVVSQSQGTGAEGVYSLIDNFFFKGRGSRADGALRTYFSTSPITATLPSGAPGAKVIIVAGTGGGGGSGGSRGGSGGAGGASNVRAYINVPFVSLSGGLNSLTIPNTYTDPFYSSAVQMGVASGGGPGGALSVTNANGTPYTTTTSVLDTLNSFITAYQFSAPVGGTSGTSGGASNGWGGGGGGGGRGGLTITLQPPPNIPSNILTPTPSISVSANNGNNGGSLYKDSGSFAYGGTGGTGGTGIGAGGGGGGGGGGTPWNDWGAGNSAGGGSGGSGAAASVFVAIANANTSSVWWILSTS